MALPRVHSGVSVPHEYLSRSDAELEKAIRAHKETLGSELVILGHHYQVDAVVGLSDFTGDSFKLCRDAANATARTIVFCGVRFMAESARIVARPEQVVIHPEETAGCPMAEMAELADVREAWKILSAMNPGRTIVPVTYMNSDADIKAFCGEHGGAVCTSSNAPRVFEWAWNKGDLVFFFPDEHLGRNTADKLGLSDREVLIWDPRYAEAHGRDERYSETRLVVWKGFCHVHTRFKVEQVEAARRDHPDAHIIVHPECPIDVVRAADSAGSTEAIVRRAQEAKAGETIIVGTEINLVARLARQNPDKTILPLVPSMCLNMAKITVSHVLWVLDNLGAIGVVQVAPETAVHARMALETMLEIG
ncbi:quinolinate synthase NadA [bacterium]|nr:quinolinate synthase NadA [bacterium]